MFGPWVMEATIPKKGSTFKGKIAPGDQLNSVNNT